MSLVSCNKLDNGKVELVIEVKGEQFKNAVEASLTRNQKKIALPGFRKGKAPRAMIVKQYGMGMFFEEAVNDLYPKAYREAADEAKIDPVDMADVEVTEMNEEGFVIKATVAVKPEAVVGKYKGIEVEKTVKLVSEDDVNVELTKVQERNARIVTREEGAAKSGDTATINFEGFVDGVAFEGGKGEAYPLTLGSGTFIPGFEDQVIGHAVNDEFDVNVTFPESYGAAELAGKPAVFKVKITEIKEKQLPVLDDEFAKDVSEFDTLAEYKADIKANLEKAAEEAAQAEVENKLMAAVVESTEVVIPDAMVQSRVDELVRDFEYRLSMQGMDMKMFMQYTGETEEVFRNTFKVQAEQQVKTRLTLEAIVKAEGITASDADMDAQYARMSEQYKMEVEKIKTLVPANDLSMDICCNKALDVVRESAVIKG